MKFYTKKTQRAHNYKVIERQLTPKQRIAPPNIQVVYKGTQINTHLNKPKKNPKGQNSQHNPDYPCPNAHQGQNSQHNPDYPLP
jgi:hypothetical protein